ncbi:MAG: alcohol dehydrogenase catalytic domain-containing protein, partial [Thermobifida sp.]|nr:alcohol dehydrogenase catalytic domain-containing protein [Thermobifida sp.]
MLAASLRAPGDLVVDKRPVPTLGPRDVLLTVEATTLCGTDLRIATGQKTNGVTPGVVLGHEIAARVWRIGDELTAGVDVPAPGTQVGLAPEIACGRCEPCV